MDSFINKMFKRKIDNDQSIKPTVLSDCSNITNSLDNEIVKTFENFTSPVLIKRKQDGAFFQNKKLRELNILSSELWGCIRPRDEKTMEAFVDDKYYQIITHQLGENSDFLVLQLIYMGQNHKKSFTNYHLESSEDQMFSRFHDNNEGISVNNLLRSLIVDVDNIFQATNIKIQLIEVDKVVTTDVDISLLKKTLKDVFIGLYFLTKEGSAIHKDIVVYLSLKGRRVCIDIELKGMVFNRSYLHQQIEILNQESMSFSQILHQLESSFSGHQNRVFIQNCSRGNGKKTFILGFSFSQHKGRYEGR